MANITLKGNSIQTLGNLPEKGNKVPEFELIKNDLSVAKLSDYKGQKLVLNIFPSLDTGTCAASVRKFNQEAANLSNTKVLCISRDLPFAQARFCGAEGLNNVETLSDFASGKFGKDYQLEITTGPLAHLNSRCVIVLNENQEVIYTEQVPEIVDEPNYQAALNVLK
jgi:thiol peroxidase